MPSLRPFDYGLVPLEHPWRQIRLVSFPPQDGSESSLRCHLEAFDLENAPMFAALLYAWGSDSNKEDILCNDDYHFRVTQSLHGALSQFACDRYSEQHKSATISKEDFSPDKRRLRLFGYQIAAIEAIRGTQKSLIAGESLLQRRLRSMLKEMPNLCEWEDIAGIRSKTKLYIADESLVDAYWQTLTAGFMLSSLFAEM